MTIAEAPEPKEIRHKVKAFLDEQFIQILGESERGDHRGDLPVEWGFRAVFRPLAIEI
jgi:hypothetical protein